ncbi:unnamed protein product, partial [Rotaria sp. Silwood1]
MSIAHEHFRKIWQTDTKNTGNFEYKALVGYDVLLAPITREEIALAIKQTNNKAAVGPDHVSLNDVQRIARNELWNGCPDDFIDLINNQYENCYTAMSYTDRSSKLISIKRGVKQGDPMSSILFNLVIDELFEIIGDHFGYELQGVGKVNGHAFADDIALISGSESGMQQLLSETEKFLTTRGFDLNVEKCIGIGLRKV